MSQRGEGSYTNTTIEPLAKKIAKEYRKGNSLMAIAKKHDLSYGALCRWARTNIDTVIWEEE